MKRFEELSLKCKASVSLCINPHKDSYLSVAEYLTDQDVDPEVLKKCTEIDRLVELTIYPDTPIGFYDIFHYDIDVAIEIALNLVDK